MFFKICICYQTTYKELKLFTAVISTVPRYVIRLPIRNWNGGVSYDFGAAVGGYQTTYKELKPQISFANKLGIRRYQTTYKELKLDIKYIWQNFPVMLSDYL